MSGQFHLNARTYLESIRAEIADYDDLQRRLSAVTAEVEARSILDLGTGTGETARAVLEDHPAAELIGIDASEEMLAIARHRLPRATFRTGRLEDPLPDGPFDLVVSAFAIHHLDGPGKRDLFQRVSGVLAPGGMFAFLDVVVPDVPVADPMRLEDGVDMPSSVDEMTGWLTGAGLDPGIAHAAADVAVLLGVKKRPVDAIA